MEYLRIFKIYFIHSYLDWFLYPFLDQRDSPENVILSHIYLLLGCAMPVWYNNLFFDAEAKVSGTMFCALAGTLSLGIGDSLASSVGKAVGIRKWSEREKTKEGFWVLI
jgi:dolichol kinase